MNYEFGEARQAQASGSHWRKALRQFSSPAGMMTCLAALLLFTACDGEQAITAVEATTEPAFEATTEPAFAIASTYFTVTPSAVTLQLGDTTRLRAVRTSD